MGDGKVGELVTRMPTGISGFDGIADGGLPRVGVTLVLGAAGAGKTMFCMQVLASGVREGEPGILVAFEESGERLLANTSSFAWNADIRASVTILDAQLSHSVETSGEFDLLGLLAMVAAAAKQTGARRVVFDGLEVLLTHLDAHMLIRREAFRLRDWAYETGLSVIITAKASGPEPRAATAYEFLEFLADCIVTLDHRVVEGIALRYVRVAKYRGAAHSANEFPFAITDEGIEVASNTATRLSHVVSNECISTGVERLDAMLSGGYYRGSSILITGVPGTAKTSLAAAFAGAAAARGERTVYVSFDEAPEQITRNVASIGIDFGPLVASGALSVHSFRRRAESPEAQVSRIRRLVRDLRPRNLVIDPLSALAQRNKSVTADDAALQVIDLAKAAGITIVGTSLLDTPMPMVEKAALNVSTIADVWLHVSYVSHGGERNRALTIIKARGTAHSNQVRELILSDEGVTLADVYAANGEVLMGTLRWEKENEDRRKRTAAANSAILREQHAELALARLNAELHALTRARALQEAELAQIKADTTSELDLRALESHGLLRRRGVDREPVTDTETDEAG